MDSRIDRLEQERRAPLTDAQRTHLRGKLDNLDTGSRALREFPLADGADEPCFVFSPRRPEKTKNPG